MKKYKLENGQEVTREDIAFTIGNQVGAIESLKRILDVTEHFTDNAKVSDEQKYTALKFAIATEGKLQVEKLESQTKIDLQIWVLTL